jgi:hypothetical protein
MQISENDLKKILFFDHWVLEWSIRILITLNIVLAGVPFDDHGYPLTVLCMTAVGFWLYVGKLKILSLAPLLFSLYITYFHLTRPLHY